MKLNALQVVDTHTKETDIYMNGNHYWLTCSNWIDYYMYMHVCDF